MNERLREAFRFEDRDYAVAKLVETWSDSLRPAAREAISQHDVDALHRMISDAIWESVSVATKKTT